MTARRKFIFCSCVDPYGKTHSHSVEQRGHTRSTDFAAQGETRASVILTCVI